MNSCFSTSSSRRSRPPCLLRPLPQRLNWCAKDWPKFIRKSRSRRFTCASGSVGMEAHRMTRKKTHKEKKSMPSAAKKLRVVHNDEAPPSPEQVAAARAEELRLLEALLFASRAPLDETTLRRHMPDGVDLKDALARLKTDYASRGVTLVKVGKKWSFRTADDLSWLLTKQTVESRKLSRAAIETLAIIAYHQPVTRAEVEEIRGVV